MFFSIIIPLKEINSFLEQTVSHIQKFPKKNWEIIILPNEDVRNPWKGQGITLLPTGRISPGEKRDIGAQYAKGDILVFLDDDSYPSSNLLEVAERDFTDPRVVSVGGPAITPPNARFWEKVSGAVFLSRLSGGYPERYVPIGGKRVVYDWPSVNLMVRKHDFLSIGGFDTRYWPGEDTRLCEKLVLSGRGHILYDPSMVVWHHRRGNLLLHLRQVGAYGKHRGFFARKYPKSSRLFSYFLPSLFLLWVVCWIILLISASPISIIFSFGIAGYMATMSIALLQIAKLTSWSVSLVSFPYIVATHLVYGYRFFQGFFSKKLVSALR